MRSLYSTYRDVLAVLPKSAGRFLLVYAIALATLSLLDAAALALLAAVTTPALSGRALTLPLLGEVSDTGLIALLGVVCILVIAKSGFAILLLWRATRRFADYELAIGARLFDGYIRAPWVERLRRNSTELVRLTDASVGITVASILLPGATLPGEFATFASILIVLAIAQPAMAAVAFVYLLLLGFLLFFVITRRSRAAGRTNQRYSVLNVRLIAEMIGALKEVSLRNKLDDIAAVIQGNRRITTRARSNVQFLNQVPRYVLDSGIIGGVVLVGITGWIGGGLVGAMSAVAIFGLAGFRMAPSIVRFQSVISTMSANQPHAEAVVREIRAVEQSTAHLADRVSADLPESPRELRFRDVEFRYTPEAEPAVSGVSLAIPMGSSVAFVGASGAGKSTVIDLLLGLVEPTSGAIDVDGVDLTELTSAWRSRVGYVPQEVALFDSTIAQNVALTWTDDVDRDLVRECLRQAQLLDLVEAREEGLDARVGERGLALSGGQRQRLGIARALYARPLVLVMDEATSALDTATEAAVTAAIRELHGRVTLITVAHRLATIRDADEVFFMADGRVAASGSFDELVAQVPEFAMQAALAGLVDPPSGAAR